MCLFYFIILLKSQISHSQKHKIGCHGTDTTATMSSIPTSSCKNILNKHALKKHAYYNQQHIISKEKVSRCRLCSSHKSLIAPSTKLLTKNIIIQGGTLGQYNDCILVILEVSQTMSVFTLQQCDEWSSRH